MTDLAGAWAIGGCHGKMRFETMTPSAPNDSVALPLTAGRTMNLSQLQTRVAREIVALARLDALRAGDHLAESLLADRIGVSRSPVNVALRYLVEVGAVVHDHNRGFFLNKDATDLSAIAQELSQEPDDPLHLKIAEDRLSGALPDFVTEADMMRQYSVARSALRKALSKIQEEGWVERSIGHGWTFLPMIDSAQAYEESYLYRTALEPTGLLSPWFRADSVELASLRRQQRAIVDGGYKTMTPIELFESNSRFHETIAKWSGNRFLVQSIKRMDSLRRLIEYGQAKDRKPRQEQAIEHLAILDAIAAQDLLKAAGLMREHLEGARQRKVRSKSVFKSAA
ncbi:GntR family transcriptional regulator [Cupriavidus pauculus]|uniref:GntR family transcriptional regulator n=1 Tax=Cupriavidus pauculus TaxID=82633 RepID=UPI001EE21719|nr:GntR family transcriptional regulator [Cupriavidus pauculus]GJG98208.1 GntR family transcriptional regulator [Cupriavidus pauculus]